LILWFFADFKKLEKIHVSLPDDLLVGGVGRAV
jgi:hypothetical protein